MREHTLVRRAGLRLARFGVLGMLAVLLSGCCGPLPIVIRWSTESEIGTAGFNVLRADNPDGPFTRVNEQLIPSSLDPILGGRYVVTDTQVTPGTTYTYRLEEVETNGTTSVLTETLVLAQNSTVLDCVFGR